MLDLSRKFPMPAPIEFAKSYDKLHDAMVLSILHNGSHIEGFRCACGKITKVFIYYGKQYDENPFECSCGNTDVRSIFAPHSYPNACDELLIPIDSVYKCTGLDSMQDYAAERSKILEASINFSGIRSFCMLVSPDGIEVCTDDGLV